MGKFNLFLLNGKKRFALKTKNGSKSRRFIKICMIFI